MAATAPLRRRPVMSDVFFLILRRMRFPLLLVISVYAVCTTGLALIPGTHPETGLPTAPMSVFEAFYVVSYTSTTIGFGEVPFPYNAAQRMWMTFTIYTSVAAWSYSLFNVIALLQDRGFQSAVRMARFSRLATQVREPFYIVCGLGETGRLVCHGLDHLGLRFVAIDINPERVQQMRLDEFSVDPPIAQANGSQPDVLVRAGLNSPWCQGVVALTDDDSTNQAIAVTVRLLAKQVAVLARIRNAETETHIGVFGGDVVINPFERFAEHLANAITKPNAYRLRDILTGMPGEPTKAIKQPPQGHWIMSGYGRFGHAVTAELRAQKVDVSVIDIQHYAEGGVDIKGTGTTSKDLEAAGVHHAVGLVTGNSSDTKNLAIAVTARMMNHNIYVVNRQNSLANTPLFDAFPQDLLMVPSRIVAQEFLARITTPLVNRFLRLIPQHNELECEQMHDRLARLNPGRHPEVWDFEINALRTPALYSLVVAGGHFTIAHLKADPLDRSRRMPIMVLMVRRDRKYLQLPDDDFAFRPNDRLLLAGSPDAKRNFEMALQNTNALNYILTGQESNGGTLWRWLTRKHPQPVVPLPDAEDPFELSEEARMHEEDEAEPTVNGELSPR